MSRHHRTLLLILLLALAVRVSTIGYALPFSFQEQEQRIVNIALKIGATGDPDPHFFGKGVLWYILLAEFGLYYLVGRSLGIFSGTFDFAKSYFVDHTPFYLIDRLNQAALAMLSIWALYLLARRLLGDKGALWASAFGAAAAYHVDASRFALVDILNALFGTLGLYQLSKYDDTGRFRNLAGAAAWVALSCSAKIPAGIFLTGILGILAVRKKILPALAVCAIFATVYALSTPAVLMSPGSAVQALQEELRIRLMLDEQTESGISLALRTLVMSGLTVPGAFLFLAGLTRPLKSSPGLWWIGMGLPAGLYMVWLTWNTTEPHYLLIIWPMLSIWLAAGVLRTAERLNAFAGTGLGALVIAGHLFFLPASHTPGVWTTMTREYLRPVPAHQMIEWVRENLPRGSKLALMAPGTFKGRLFPVPEEIRDRIERAENMPMKFSIDYSAGNVEMYRWILRIVESDSEVPAYRIVNLDMQTSSEQEGKVRRTNLVYVENLLPFENWRDVNGIDADYFLFVDGMDKPDGRLRAVWEKLSRRDPVVAFPPFYLYPLK